MKHFCLYGNTTNHTQTKETILQFSLGFVNHWYEVRWFSIQFQLGILEISFKSFNASNIEPDNGLKQDFAKHQSIHKVTAKIV